MVPGGLPHVSVSISYLTDTSELTWKKERLWLRSRMFGRMTAGGYE